MDRTKALTKLNKILAYALGRRPDEFGLAPDPGGWVPVKELLQAFSEDPNLPHVRAGYLNELLLTLPSPSVEMDGKRIRAKNPPAFNDTPDPDPPKLLYTAVRERGYAVILDKGLIPPERARVVLARERDMAKRLGRRRAPYVLLTVQTGPAMDMGAVFIRSGEDLYTAEFIPAGTFTGPPLAKVLKDEPLERKKKPAEKKPPEAPPVYGSFTPDPSVLAGPGEKAGKHSGKQKKGWKERARKERRKKRF